MIGQCQRCGKQAEGNSYGFYCGLVLGTQSASYDLLVARMRTSTTSYRVLGREEAFVCNQCAGARIPGGGVAISLLLGAGVLALGIWRLVASAGRPHVRWWPSLFCLALPGLLVFLFGLIGIAMNRARRTGKNPTIDKEEGVRAAIEARRGTIQGAHPGQQVVFWSPKEYERLVRKQKR